jgi:hypothetical protein
MAMEAVFGLAFILPLLGLMVMIVMPRDWQNVPGWLMVSYLGLPAFIAVLALLVNAPLLIGGVLFMLGIAAVSKK